MECLGGDVNRMECGSGEVDGEGRVWAGEVGVKFGLGLGLVKSGLRRLCVVSATTQSCCKCNNFIQYHAPG